VTHIAVLVGGRSHPGVHVGNVTGGPDDQGRPGVNDGLAAAGARHRVTIDGDTEDGANRTASEVMQVNHHNVYSIYGCGVQPLPVHLDLPVGGGGQGDPGDASSIVALIDSAEDHHAALLTVAESTQRRHHVIVYLIYGSRSILSRKKRLAEQMTSAADPCEIKKT